MTRIFTISALVVVSATLWVTDASAQDNYLAPAIVYTDDGKDRLLDDEVTGGQLAFGHFFSDNIALEALIGTHRLQGFDNADMLELGLNGVLTTNRNHRFAPYALLGIGTLDVDSKVYDNSRDTFFTAGVGFRYRLGDSPFGLRLEYRLRDTNQGAFDFDDRLTSLGVTLALGRSEPPPPPPPPADPDSDGDGVPDSRDRCPNTPAGYRVDANGCPLDSDGDGVADAIDECPNTFRGAPVDARGCERDDDKDGVVNRLDKCPNTRAGVRVDVNGCEITDVIDLPGVNFRHDSDRLLPGAEGVLGDAAATLKKYPDLRVEVAGHTDSQGAADYNQGLSERRANTVRDYLINAGVPASQLTARGYGEADPVADNATADGRARNRRVELRIISN